MATAIDPQTLFEEAKCYACYSNASMAELLKLALLNRASQGGGSTTDIRAANYGGAQPTFTPTGSLGIAIDTSDETVYWYYSGAWHP